MSSVEDSIKDVHRIMQTNIQQILQRGEDLHSLSRKVDELRDASALFKKRAKQLKEEVKPFIPSLPTLPSKPVEVVETVKTPTLTKQSSLDYLTEIEDTHMSEYEKKLMEYYHQGHYQYVLEKASQLGLIRFVNRLLELSTYYPIDLNIFEALNTASYFGHVEIVEALLNHDVENERYYGKAPREEIISVLPFVDDKPRIPYTNEPLSHDNIRKAIITAYSANHTELAKILESYYYRTHAIKDRHDIKKANQFLSKLI
jgi:hypothetical protein